MVTISGYVIYRTQVLNDEKNVVLKTSQDTTLYFYVKVGENAPTLSDFTNASTNNYILDDDIETKLYKDNARIPLDTKESWPQFTHTINYNTGYYIGNSLQNATGLTYYIILPTISGHSWWNINSTGATTEELGTSASAYENISNITFNNIRYDIYKFRVYVMGGQYKLLILR